MATSTEVAIATTTLSSATSSITFSSIPSTYTDLRVVLTIKSVSNADNLQIRFNSDSATNYSQTLLTGNGTAASSTRYTSQSVIWDATSLSTTQPSFITLDIFSYAGSTYKTALMSSNEDYNGSGFVKASVQLWRSTSAINTILMQMPSTFTFAAGTTATLYGIL